LLAAAFTTAATVSVAAGSPDGPSCAALVVTDRSGEPVAGARVHVAENHSDVALLEGSTDSQGRLCSDGIGGLSSVVVTVNAPAFERWAMFLSGQAALDQPIRLDRALDEAFIRAAAAEEDPQRSEAMMLEIVGVRQMGLDEVAVYPYIGELRDKLLPFATGPAWETPDDRGLYSPATRARSLLSLWCDPRDEAVIGAYIDGRKTHRPLDAPITGATEYEAVARWARVHFDQEGVDTDPYWHPAVASGLDGEHALVTFTVRYAHWGYSILLPMRRDEGVWTMRHTVDFQHFHFDR